jgi:hypothetical protein
MYIRKFYDAAAEEAKADVKPKFTMGEAFNAEDLSAESDKFNNREEKVEDKVDEKLEEKIENKVDEKIIDKKEEKIEDKKEDLKPVVQDWKELAKANRKELLELLEIDEDTLNMSKDLKGDDFVKKALTYRKEHGNLTPFIEAATRDWDKVSPEQLVMDDLKKQYAHLSPEKAEKLAKFDFNQRFTYKDDPELSEEENGEMADLAATRLESEGLKIRAAKKTEQTQFLDSVKPVDKTVETQKLAQEAEATKKAELEKFSSMYDTDPASVKLSTEKKIVLGKEKPFNYPVNPVSIKEQTLDTNKFYDKFWAEKNGKNVFNADHWNRVIAYSENPEAFEEALINHGMSQGLKIVDDELENAKEKTDNKVTPTKKSLAKSVSEGKEFSFNGQ